MKMNKKILLVSTLAVFMLLTISFASAINTNNTDIQREESPLYRIRTSRAIKEKIPNIIENIKTKFIGERIFFLPFQWPRNEVSNLPILHFSLITECQPDCEMTDIMPWCPK